MDQPAQARGDVDSDDSEDSGGGSRLGINGVAAIAAGVVLLGYSLCVCRRRWCRQQTDELAWPPRDGRSERFAKGRRGKPSLLDDDEESERGEYLG